MLPRSQKSRRRKTVRSVPMSRNREQRNLLPKLVTVRSVPMSNRKKNSLLAKLVIVRRVPMLRRAVMRQWSPNQKKCKRYTEL
ncbi:uncharacterized protein LOC121726349 isoform X2 [Aricia agestis]|uniref:uncharacterized protein LOC121726349 isoform X2 n=1 Tax=Aricia agestis TaxID=91739 RepID=UPI001C208761|nr:uncharacterized protein LOC121726349 isoform X2 [Aricia agestis]